MLDYIIANRLRWDGHVTQGGENGLNIIVFGKRQFGRTKVGQPKKWRNANREDLKKIEVM